MVLHEFQYKIARPLTFRMIEVLMDCHERELLNLEPYNAGHVNYLRGLILRGMLEVKTYRPMFGREFQALFITSLGREYLSYL